MSFIVTKLSMNFNQQSNAFKFVFMSSSLVRIILTLYVINQQHKVFTEQSFTDSP